ncbi:hypothetical protein NEFER03_1258 [Nematocida sp. LUAm3]|nr:hypothetical protein NEFER03_1258 [Nematocida sp. LUAm3]KAI5174120.1 hypothetical protein NEFER02_0587 [Nematocida sp. LUAm2]KAI5177137.1 hypothetical protein NEFER01_0412 [Nematocida sp. LUAm1]
MDSTLIDIHYFDYMVYKYIETYLTIGGIEELEYYSKIIQILHESLKAIGYVMEEELAVKYVIHLVIDILIVPESLNLRKDEFIILMDLFNIEAEERVSTPLEQIRKRIFSLYTHRGLNRDRDRENALKKLLTKRKQEMDIEIEKKITDNSVPVFGTYLPTAARNVYWKQVRIEIVKLIEEIFSYLGHPFLASRFQESKGISSIQEFLKEEVVEPIKEEQIEEVTSEAIEDAELHEEAIHEEELYGGEDADLDMLAAQLAHMYIESEHRKEQESIRELLEPSTFSLQEDTPKPKYYLDENEIDRKKAQLALLHVGVTSLEYTSFIKKNGRILSVWSTRRYSKIKRKEEKNKLKQFVTYPHGAVESKGRIIKEEKRKIWKPEEQDRFIKAVKVHGKSWEKIQQQGGFDYISLQQIRDKYRSLVKSKQL